MCFAVRVRTVMPHGDARAQDGRCAACGTHLDVQRSGSRFGFCINVDCPEWGQVQPLRRPRPDAGAAVRAAANREGVA